MALALAPGLEPVPDWALGLEPVLDSDWAPALERVQARDWALVLAYHR